MERSSIVSDKPSNFEYVINMFTRPIYPEQVPRMTPQEQAEFINGLVDGSIFSSMHIHEVDKKRGDLTRVFLPHAGDYFKALPNHYLHDIGILWAFMKEQSGKQFRGSVTKVAYPTFTMVRLCSKDDWDVAVDGVKAKKAEAGIIEPS